MICDGAVGVPRGEPGDGPMGRQVRTSVRKRETSFQQFLSYGVLPLATGHLSSRAIRRGLRLASVREKWVIRGVFTIADIVQE